MSFNCSFCEKDYSTKASLIKHQRSTKACILIRKESNISKVESIQFQCEYCKKNFTARTTLDYHVNICKEKKDKDALLTENNIKNLKEELDLQTIFIKKQTARSERSKKTYERKLAKQDEKIASLKLENSIVNETLKDPKSEIFSGSYNTER